MEVENLPRPRLCGVLYILASHCEVRCRTTISEVRGDEAECEGVDRGEIYDGPGAVNRQRTGRDWGN